MKQLPFLFLLLFGLILSSCEDLLIKDYELEDEFYEPKIVVNSTIDSNSDTLWMSITENFSLNTKYEESLKLISEAEINLIMDGQNIEVIPNPIENRFYNYFVPEMQSFEILAKTFELTVSAEGFETVTASTTVPKKAEVTDIIYERDAIQTPFGDSNDRLQFKIEDDEDVDDYYLFRLSSFFRDTIFDGNDTFIEVYENYATLIDQTQLGGITFGNNSREVVSTDQTFNGQNYQFNFEVEGFFSENETIYLEATKLSREAYLFLISYNNYRESTDFGFFSEPVTLYSNIENGYGRLESRSTELIEIME